MDVLIAEDELPTRRGILSSLEQCSEGRWRIHAAANGLEALEYARRQPVDLLITDIRMPGMNGIELLKQLKAERRDTVSILLTGYAEFEYARSALQLGAVNYILKPVDHEGLVQAVQQAMELVKERRAQQGGRKELSEEEAFMPKVHNEAIRKALTYIRAELSSATLTMKEVAEHIHLNPSYTSSLFKEETHQTFSEFVNRLRLIRAKELLLRSDKKVYEIAEEVGFSSSKYFVQVFRDLEGMTPNQYRMELRD